jgi:hypothetical protein
MEKYFKKKARRAQFILKKDSRIQKMANTIGKKLGHEISTNEVKERLEKDLDPLEQMKLSNAVIEGLHIHGSYANFLLAELQKFKQNRTIASDFGAFMLIFLIALAIAGSVAGVVVGGIAAILTLTPIGIIGGILLLGLATLMILCINDAVDGRNCPGFIFEKKAQLKR